MDIERAFRSLKTGDLEISIRPVKAACRDGARV
jgi:hypothetical protein